MSTFGLILIVVVVCAALYYFFRPGVHLIMPDELKSIETDVRGLLEPDPMDHEFILNKKNTLRSQFSQCAYLFARNPPGFTKEEAESLKSMPAETKQLLKDVCKNMEELKGPLENALNKSKDGVEKLKVAIKDGVTSEEADDDNEDAIDDLEGMLESMQESVKKHTAEKQKLEYSLRKYRSL
jgi:hypothetical protein